MSTLSKPNTVAVIGTGTMGRGIIQILAQSEHVSTVYWKGRDERGSTEAYTSLKTQWDRLVAKKRLAQESAEAYASKIICCSEYSELSASDCIIEAVAENMSAKREIFQHLVRIAKPEAILASNTSSLSITELSSIASNPGQVIGLHFFNPAPVMRLVEVVVGIATSQQTIDWALDFAKKLGKDPVVVNEAPGFIVNRMLIPMINEAIGILAEGVASAEEIDKAMRFGANHPIGPLALADLIGNDVNLSIMETLHNETGDPKYRAHPLLRKMVRGNRLGRKTGSGFFDY
ncbi:MULTISPECIES: 3-hydroxyacyl-CoA dehydrogenase family protein [unclassified Pseudomonas]|uniref:3-hydroxyacyl-CoA dehydrogenase family protein n=1 Tax=unclassified Pseudomonas TaxID=196821 RepID=UPI001CC18D94|nr:MULTISPECIES: 3-hydroxyacyl-CoA dehydrogenase NAD-binding domain-containing protein [unclassified Pseudomonas]